MLGILKYALANNIPVEMIYLAVNGVLSQRIVTVKEITEQNVKGFCHLRKSVRTFKLVNILAVMPYNKQTRKRVS